MDQDDLVCFPEFYSKNNFCSPVVFHEADFDLGEEFLEEVKRKKHIPLLKSMKQKSIEVASAYDIDENQLYFFFHYHPSFYHLHLHCCIINNPELSTKYFRCKMLETIISNLERNSNYYKNADILFEIPSNHIIAKLLS